MGLIAQRVFDNNNSYFLCYKRIKSPPPLRNNLSPVWECLCRSYFTCFSAVFEASVPRPMTG
ncbi:hypothetical protein HanIR_Chr04g0198041 [Helianthus annuus]|nr:hypothetical protein HanIR_Chr04g0198041 [Helianthus annuus]